MRGKLSAVNGPAYGKVDGCSVEYYYQDNDENGDMVGFGWRELHCRENETPSDEVSMHAVPLRNIIALLPSHAERSDDFTLLYCGDNTDASDPGVSPVTFKSVVITSPPKILIDRFIPSGDSFWQSRHDQDKQKPSLHIVISTGSGTGLGNSVWKSLLKPLLQHVSILQDKDYSLHITTSPNSITELISSIILPAANKGHHQTVILLSGDGGIIDTTNALLSAPHTPQYQRPTLSLLPLGTGNALAHSTKITADNTFGLSVLFRGRPAPLALFTAIFSPGSQLLTNEGQTPEPLPSDPAGSPTLHGAVVVSWGLHASLVADSDTAAYRRYGAERFQLAAKEALFPSDGSPPHAYRGKVSLLRKSASAAEQAVWHPLERQEHGYILATFCSQLESGFTISPASRPLDGQLRVVHFGPLDGEAAMGIMGAAYQGGRHVSNERVGYEAVEGLRVEFEEDEERWRRVCVDGKIVRVERDGWVEVRSGGGGGGVVDVVVLGGDRE